MHLHALVQIVSFKPGCNLNSEEYGDDMINLLGEIHLVSLLLN
jgi:hypothetical protein